MEATSGEVTFDGHGPEARSDAGYLTQAFSLYPDLTVAENLRYVGDLRRSLAHRLRERGSAISKCSIWTASRDRPGRAG